MDAMVNFRIGDLVRVKVGHYLGLQEGVIVKIKESPMDILVEFPGSMRVWYMAQALVPIIPFDQLSIKPGTPVEVTADKPFPIPQRRETDVSKQPHYTQFKIQPITFIEANGLSYSQGNVIKYVCRYKSKDGLKDLHKLKRYVEYLIQLEETGEVIP